MGLGSHLFCRCGTSSPRPPISVEAIAASAICSVQFGCIIRGRLFSADCAHIRAVDCPRARPRRRLGHLLSRPRARPCPSERGRPPGCPPFVCVLSESCPFVRPRSRGLPSESCPSAHAAWSSLLSCVAEEVLVFSTSLRSALLRSALLLAVCSVLLLLLWCCCGAIGLLELHRSVSPVL